MKPTVVLIDCKSKIVQRFFKGNRAEKALLPALQDKWIRADLELFRVYGLTGLAQDIPADPKEGA
jgi:hypothetical protein